MPNHNPADRMSDQDQERYRYIQQNLAKLQLIRQELGNFYHLCPEPDQEILEQTLDLLDCHIAAKTEILSDMRQQAVITN